MLTPSKDARDVSIVDVSVKWTLGASVVIAAMGLTACGSSSPPSQAPPISDAGVDGMVEAASDATQAPDGGPGEDDAGNAGPANDVSVPPAPTFLRVVHASPDSDPFDVCVAPHGTATFQGPLVAQLEASLAPPVGDGATDAQTSPAGVSYGQVSAYLSLDPGAYDVRIVAAGASSCDVSQGPPDSGVPEAGSLEASSTAGDASTTDTSFAQSLGSGTYWTLLVAGDRAPAGSDQPLTEVLLPDDAVLGGGIAELRAVNASSSVPSLDFGLGSGASWLSLLPDVGFGHASAQAGVGEDAVDANGYQPIGTAPLVISARASGADAGADLAIDSDFVAGSGAIMTMFAIGDESSAHPLSLLVCTDNQPAGALLSDCSIASP